jgi:hypothetical protein
MNDNRHVSVSWKQALQLTMQFREQRRARSSLSGGYQIERCWQRLGCSVASVNCCPWRVITSRSPICGGRGIDVRYPSHTVMKAHICSVLCECVVLILYLLQIWFLYLFVFGVYAVLVVSCVQISLLSVTAHCCLFLFCESIGTNWCLMPQWVCCLCHAMLRGKGVVWWGAGSRRGTQSNKAICIMKTAWRWSIWTDTWSR